MTKFIFQPIPETAERVRDKLPVPKICKCGGDVVIRHHEQVYGQTYSNWPWMYVCEWCFSSVGMHPCIEIPLGTLADRKTRKARREAKTMFFDTFSHLSRGAAYKKLSEMLGIEERECHFGWFSYEQCVNVMREIKQYEG